MFGLGTAHDSLGIPSGTEYEDLWNKEVLKVFAYCGQGPQSPSCRSGARAPRWFIPMLPLGPLLQKQKPQPRVGGLARAKVYFPIAEEPRATEVFPWA